MDYLNGVIDSSAALGPAPTVSYEIRDKKVEEEEDSPSKKLKTDEKTVETELDDNLKHEKILNAQRLDKPKLQVQTTSTDMEK